MIKSLPLPVLVICLWIGILPAQDTLLVDDSVNALYKRLSAIPDSIKYKEMVLFFRQPISHTDSAAGYFDQRVYLHHRGFNQPMVFNTEGYAVEKGKIVHLSHLLDANQIVAEHRYFGESVPDSMNWNHLNIRESAGDHHHIIELLKEIYHGKWITMGISKGGQTAMYHRRFYPDDADATVCYVAPLNFSDREPRIKVFLSKVGDASCRERIEAFQRILLQTKNELLPMFSDYARENDYSFSLGTETAYEYGVLEIPFAFWQWSSVPCDALPTSGTPLDTLFDRFIRIASPYYFSNRGIALLYPLFSSGPE